MLKQWVQGQLTITLPTLRGGSIELQIDDNQLQEKYGVSCFSRVQINKDRATIIGEYEGNLWFLQDDENGVSYWGEITSKKTFGKICTVLEKDDEYVHPLLEQCLPQEERDEREKERLKCYWEQIQKGNRYSY